MDWKDAVLEAAMREKTGIVDRAIRLSDVYDIEEFEFTGTEEATIKNVDALGELVNLKKLFLDNNEITDISALKSLTKMEEISMTRNPLESIEVLSAWKNLKSLTLMGCGIQDISVLKNLTQLTEILLTVNEITDVTPLAGLKNLTQLYLGMNQITDISALKDLTNLETFTVNMNVGISDISVISGFKKLQILSIYGLESISNLTPLAGMGNLTELGICVNEAVTGSAVTVTTTFDQVVKKLGQLQTLDISRTTFKDLGAVLTSLKEIGSLNKLALRSVNDITDETLNSLCTLEHLTELDLGYNDFYNVDLSLLKNLKNSAIKLWLNDSLLNEESIPEETLTDLQSSIPNLNPPRE